jgi:hypothetical protein
MSNSPRSCQDTSFIQEGWAAMRQLWNTAQGSSGQSRYIAEFLLGLYNGPRFPFDLTSLRALDTDIAQDCLAALRLDAAGLKEVHRWLDKPSEAFEQLAAEWGIEEAAQ